MPYYSAGDYYGREGFAAGDYYQGDIFGIGKLIGGVAKAVGGVVGGPIGAVLRVGGGILAPKPPGMAVTPFAPGPGGLIPAPGGMHMTIPPGRVLVGGGQAGIPIRPQLVGIPHGLHPNRSTYVTRGGGTSHWPVQLLVHPKGTENVRTRRMNVGNARALKRALRRARGFERLARSVMVVHRFKRHPGKKRK